MSKLIGAVCAPFFVGLLMTMPGLGCRAGAPPTVFWAPDSNEPGNVVLLYGGGLGAAKFVRVWRVPDTAAAALPASKTVSSSAALQPTASSVKFLLPAKFAPGVYAAQVVTSGGVTAPVLLNRPQVWFLQPKTLAPGLTQDQAPPGATVQIIGKDFLLPHDQGTPHVALRPEHGGAWRALRPSRAERFSLFVPLPARLPVGRYALRVSNGFGGVAAWSAPLTINIKRPDVWPGRVFSVKNFAALGDGVHDDTKAVRAALAAAERNGGGVVYFPWGTYRLSDWIAIPQRTILRGDSRDGTVLQWPVDVPKSLADFSPAAVYSGGRYGIENLTLIARKVDTILLNLNTGTGGVPPELQPRMQPWGAMQDVFLRHVNFEHWLLAGHPDRQKALWDTKYTGDGAYNFRISGVRNFQVSGCLFQGGSQMFMNLRNSRVTDNSFSNTMGYCWTVLGGGTHYEVCTGNNITASSSWGYAGSGIRYVYSAHNVSHNFVRGEREAMTLDISALPTARPVSQFWGTPVEVGNAPGSVFLRFPPPGGISPDGFNTGFVPDSFRGGAVTIHAYTGGPGAGQTRRILGNTADTLTLDRPWDTPPDTTPRKLYLEVAPRMGGTAAWFGRPTQVHGRSLTFQGAKWVPQEFVDMAVLVLDGKGVGQYRAITGNTTDTLTLARPWDVPPDAKSSLGIWSVMRHMIVYDSQGYDTSAFAQLWGSFYDYTVDSCRVERDQGLWGQTGWFVQFRDNRVSYANTFHPGIGPHGDNPEGNMPFSFVGLMPSNLRIGKFGALQYGVPGGKSLFVSDVLSGPVLGGYGAIIKGNVLRYNQRIAVPPFDIPNPRSAGHDVFRDLVIDDNRIEHSPVGVQVGPDIGGVVTAKNQFLDVKQPYLLAKPSQVLRVGAVGK